ncbi:MAG TPA: phenylalanine--tRNA ligase subunit beta [Dehalococcoidia bacterium]|nr:phenylalanine--tRNA ligase subunit beta [Dehalococcoidia bacterium]
MKVPLKWLQEYVAPSVPEDDLASKLTMAGIEVGERQAIGGSWEKIVVGQLVSVEPHPNADRLKLVTVDLGTEQLTVVCGDPTLKLGDKVPFAHVGATLIDGRSGEQFHLKSAKIRGIASQGMLCSEKELGISDSHEVIMVLPAEAPVGVPLADYLGDTVFDLDVTPNRPDCLSVIGIAREAAALTGQPIKINEPVYNEGGTPIERQVAIEIKAPDLCSRYCAGLITGIKIAESPPWLQQRLLACGMRPINNIVDVSNYVMLEYGQPLHAFDYNQIRGQKIIVRRANSDEIFVTLDGVERKLSQDMLVIADEQRAVALAGVMGGLDSEVSPNTTAILLESANFNPANIHHTSRLLWLTSEASMRYERGIRPELAVPALKRAIQLMLQMAGGEAAAGFIDVYPGRQEPTPILLSPELVTQLLGVEFSPDQIVTVLTSLGFNCERSASEIRVTPPYWRSDITIAADLVEEVARIIGYDRIPLTMLSRPIPKQDPKPIFRLKQQVMHSLVGYGFQEIICFSLTSREALNKAQTRADDDKPPLRLSNPMTTEQEFLRPSLRASILTALAANQRHEEGVIRLFEVGRVYLARPGDLPEEPEMVCGVMSGAGSKKSWHGEDRPVDFYDGKGVVEALFQQLGVAAKFEKGQDNGLHPTRQVAIAVNGQTIGVVGELHPEVAQAFEISVPTCLFEIDLSAVLPFASDHRMFQPIARFPAVVRDIALVVDKDTSNQQVTDIISSFPMVSQVAVFDVYSGAPVPVDKKSLAYRIRFQSIERTLTDEEVNDIQQQIMARLATELGVTLRN